MLCHWGGFYIGIHGGGDWFNKDWIAPNTPTNIVVGCGAGAATCDISVGGHCPCSNLHKAEKDRRFLRAGHTVTVMVTILSAIVSIFEFRVRSRTSLELELVALRHQVTVLWRQRPGGLSLHP